MTRTKLYRNIALAGLVICSIGLTAGITCTGVSDKLVHNINPCGTILNCSPVEYDLLTHQDYPNWNVDPTCTIYGQCGTVWPPTGTSTSQPATTTTTKSIR